jgi:hypothetical protein
MWGSKPSVRLSAMAAGEVLAPLVATRSGAKKGVARSSLKNKPHPREWGGLPQEQCVCDVEEQPQPTRTVARKQFTSLLRFSD